MRFINQEAQCGIISLTGLMSRLVINAYSRNLVRYSPYLVIARFRYSVRLQQSYLLVYCNKVIIFELAIVPKVESSQIQPYQVGRIFSMADLRLAIEQGTLVGFSLKNIEVERAVFG